MHRILKSSLIMAGIALVAAPAFAFLSLIERDAIPQESAFAAPPPVVQSLLPDHISEVAQ